MWSLCGHIGYIGDFRFRFIFLIFFFIFCSWPPFISSISGGLNIQLTLIDRLDPNTGAASLALANKSYNADLS